MKRAGWTVARLDEIPSSADIPVVARFEQFLQLAGARKRKFHAARRYLGISSFGVNAAEASAGGPLIVPHDETQYGQACRRRAG